ncbi:MAG: hypothetical protein ACE5F5_13155 [Acidimicrobiia bacterium]
MTIFDRLAELQARLPNFEVEAGADCHWGDLDPETLIVVMGAELGLRAEEVLDLTRPLAEILRADQRY